MIVARLIVPAAFREPDTAAVLTGLSLLRPARGLLREMVGKRRDWFIEQVKDRPVGGAPKVLRQPFELTSGFIREAKDPVIRLPYGIRSARRLPAPNRYGLCALAVLHALSLPEAVEFALQQDAQHRPHWCQPRNVTGDRPLEPDCRLCY